MFVALKKYIAGISIAALTIIGLAPIAAQASETFTLSGTVTDSETSSPISNSQLSVCTADGNYCFGTQTDINGEYSLPGLVAGAYSINAYTLQSPRYYNHQDSVEISGDFTLSFTMSPWPVGSSELRGTILNSNGEYVSNATVSIWANGDERNYVSVTSETGEFGFIALPSGIYEVQIEATGYFTIRTRVSLTETNTTILNRSVEPQGANTLSGKVSNAAEENAAVVGLNMWACTARTDISWCGSATTDADGNYEFTGAPLGRVNVWGDTVALKFEQMNASAVLVAGVNNLDIALKPFPTGTGKISGSVKDTSGNALEGAYVNLWSDKGRSYSASGAGAFSFDNLPDGTYWLSGYKSGYLTGSALKIVVSSGGQMTQNVELKARPTGVLTGRVTSAENSETAIAGVSITVCSQGKFAMCVGATSDSGGIYQVSGVPEGSLKFTARAQQGFEPIRSVAFNFTGPTQYYPVEMTPFVDGNYEVHGTIKDFDGAPIENLSVHLSVLQDEWSWDSELQNGTTLTNSRGEYSFTGLPAGYARVSASSGDLTQFYRQGQLTKSGLTLDGGLYPRDAQLSVEVSTKEVGSGIETPLTSGSMYVTISDASRGISDGAYANIGADGIAVFENLPRYPNAKYVLNASEIVSDGWLESGQDLEIDALAAGENTAKYLLNAAPAGPAKFTTVVLDDESEQPLPGVDFQYDASINWGGKYLNRRGFATSDEAGNLVIDGLIVGSNLSIYFDPEFQSTNSGAYGYESGYQTADQWLQVMSLNERPREFHISKGTSRSNNDGDGVFSGLVTDTSGNPVPYAEFYVYNSNYSNYWSANTDDLGNFSLTGLPIDSYYVEFNNQGGFASLPKPLTFEITADAPVVSNQNIVLNRIPEGTGEINGQSFNLTDSQGLSGLQVNISMSMPADNPDTSTIDESLLNYDIWHSATTDADGNWSVSGLQAGRYEITYGFPDGESVDKTKHWLVPNVIFVDVEEGAVVTLDATNFEYLSESISTLKLQPIDEKTRLPIDAELSCYLYADAVWSEQNVDTDETQTAVFKNLIAGQTYNVQCSPRNWNELYVPYKRQSFVAQSGDHTLKLPLKLIHINGTMSGYVRDEQGNPIPNVRVSTGMGFAFDNCRCGDGFGGADITDKNGFYELGMLSPDGITDISVTPTRGDFADIRGTFQAIAGPQEKDFVLTKGAQVQGSLVDELGNGINSYVTLSSVTSAQSYGTNTRTSGDFTFDNSVALGDYIVYFGGWSDGTDATASGYLTADGKLSGDKTLAKVFTVDQAKPAVTQIPTAVGAEGASITGKVTFKTATGEALASNWYYALARIYAKTASGWEQIPGKEGWISSSRRGEYSITGLPAGKYKIEFGDYWTVGARYEPVFNGGATSLSAAAEITLVPGQILKDVDATLKFKKPSENVATLSLDGLEESDVLALENQLGLTTTSSGIEVQATEDMAGEWIAVMTTSTTVTSAGEVRAASVPSVTKSGWVQLDKNARAVVPSTVFKSTSKTVIIGNASNSAIGWSAIKKAAVVTKPAITGTLKRSKTVTVSAGTWTAVPTATSTYQWYVCSNKASTSSKLSSSAKCKSISGATKSSYKISSSYAGKYLVARVGAKNSAGTSYYYVATSKVGR